MKTLVTNYTFSAASKQVTFTDYPSIKLDQILLITNVTDNIIIYNFADPTAGGTLAGNVLTLTYNTTTMSNTDRLQIFIDDYVVPSTEASLTAVQVRIDNTNTLLNVLTGKQTTVNLDVSAINVNTDELEGLVANVNTRLNVLTAVDFATRARQDFANSLLTSLTSNVLDIENLIISSNTSLNSLTANVLDIENIANDLKNNADYLNQVSTQTRDYVVYTSYNYFDINAIKNSLFQGIGGYSLGGYFNSYNRFLSSNNILLSSIDATLKAGSTNNPNNTSDGNVKKLAADTLTNVFVTPSANKIYNIFGISTASIGQYIQVYDVNSTTPVGAPAGVFYVPANSNFNFEFTKGIPIVNNNAVIVNSLTPITYNSGNSDLYITVIYN